MSGIVLNRPARIEDADEIATIHATSWRENYRGAYSDAFLDGPVFEDRRAVWRDRLGFPPDGSMTFVAELGIGVVGFVHLQLDADPHRGALVDNLHVVGALRGQGIGTGLLDNVGRYVLDEAPGSALYLWVLVGNVSAQAFYRSLGGVIGGEESRHAPDGSDVQALCVSWNDPAALLVG